MNKVSMSFTSKGKRWEILHSLWIGWTFTFGLFNWIAFIYIGLRAKQWKWILWGVLYLVPIAVVILLLAADASAALGVPAVLLTFGVGVASIFHAFWLRGDYLRRLETLGGSDVTAASAIRSSATVSSQERRPKPHRSLWVGWTFVPLLNWVAFVYVGIRAKQPKWIFWGLIYLAPWTLPGFNNTTWQWLTGTLSLVAWIASIAHAFLIRQEYRMRLGTSLGTASEVETAPSGETSGPANASVPNSVGVMPDKPPERAVDVPAISLPYEDLFTICAKYEGDGYYVGEAIGRRRLTNAHNHFSIPDTDRMVALIDTSITRSGKSGLALCEGGIYWRNGWTANTKTYKTFLLWTEFVSVAITFREDPPNIVEFGKGSELYVTENDIKKGGLSNLLSEAQSLARNQIEKHRDGAALGQNSQTSVEEARPIVHPEQDKQTRPNRNVRTAPPSPEIESAGAATSRQPIRSNISAESDTPQILSGDELEYQISSSYPFPIAFGFRSLMSIVDYRDLYREQLRIAENILAFLASVSLTLLREQDRQKADIDLEEYWRSGISPGDWKDIVGRCSRVFSTYEDNPLALGISGLNIRSEKKGFGHDVAKLIQAKNDYKHDRGPNVLEDIAEASQEVQERLKQCMEKLSFLSTYPIRQVEDFNISRSGNEVFLKTLRYMGDHPSFSQEEVVFHRGLTRGDLFLDLDGGKWVALYPFIVPMTCSHCKARETYFIDLWDSRRGTARMKSFERGHTMNNPGVSEALANWKS